MVGKKILNLTVFLIEIEAPLIRQTTDGLMTDRRGCITADENGLTTKERVYAGGDVVTGAATVILVMGAGKKAAEAIDNELMGK